MFVTVDGNHDCFVESCLWHLNINESPILDIGVK